MKSRNILLAAAAMMALSAGAAAQAATTEEENEETRRLNLEQLDAARAGTNTLPADQSPVTDEDMEGQGGPLLDAPPTGPDDEGADDADADAPMDTTPPAADEQEDGAQSGY
jgi:hypothetical protein